MRLRRAFAWCVAFLLVVSTGLAVSEQAGGRSATGQAVQGPAETTANADPDFLWTQDWVESPQWGGRVGYVDTRGFLRVRMRSEPDAEWVVVAKDVQSFQLFDWRLAVLTSAGRLLQQEGPLNAPLVEIASGVCGYQLTLTRTGILGCDHTFSVREMGFEARPVARGVRAFQIETDRVALLGFDGVLWGQQGGEARGFSPLASNVRSFQIERDWLAYIEAPHADASGKVPSSRLMAGTWEHGKALSLAEAAAGVTDFELEASIDSGPGFRTLIHLAAVHADGSISVAAGRALPLALTRVDRGPAERVAWAGGRLAVLGAGKLRLAGVGQDGFVAGFTEVRDKVSAFQASPEGALAIVRAAGGGRVVEFLDLATPDEIEANEPGAADSGVSGARLPAAVRIEVKRAEPAGLDGQIAPGVAGVVVSSLRPRHVRRMVEGPPLDLAAVGGRIASAAVAFADEAVPPTPASALLSPESSGRARVEASPARPLDASTAIPLYQLYLPTATDHFYTTSASERLAAQGFGFVDQGIAAWVEPSQAAGTAPFWRFYIGSPQTNHFYTTSSAEYSYVVSIGFTYEGIEGYLYTSNAAGTVPLYRLYWFNGANGDIDHFYTTSVAARDSMLMQGWALEGIAGYVWPSGPGPAGDDATPVSTSVPGSVTAGSSFAVSVTMKNTGGTTWTAASNYRLGSQKPQDNLTWGTNRVTLPASAPPGSSVTFAFNAVAPTAPGVYNFQWQMVHDGVAWFGARTTNVAVTVTGAANQQPLGTLESLSTAYFSVQGWAYDPDVPTQSIVVHIDIDGSPVADVITDQPRPDVNSAFGITGNHGFAWYLTGPYRSGTHTLRAYAVDPATGQRVELALSPKTYSAGGTYSISGNTGVPDATITAGAYSVTSDANGYFTLSNLSAATYTLTATKSGCLFYPASQSVTVGPSQSRIFFSSPCRLHYVRGVTSFADQYIQAYPYAGNLAAAHFTFTETYAAPNNTFPCRAIDDGRVTCRPNLPLWKSNTGSRKAVCSSLLFNTRQVNKIRPRVGEFVACGTNNYAWCSTCTLLFPQIDACTEQLGLHICAYENFLNYIRVADAIGSRGGAFGCASPFQSYVQYWNGPISGNVYEGEITPNYWGLVPASVDLRQWQTLAPGGHSVFQNDSQLGITMAAGDGYWTSEPIVMDPPPLLGGSGPNCLFGNDECFEISSRSRASRFGDKWYITISGYMTDTNPIGNTVDANQDLDSLAQIRGNFGSYATVNSQVSDVINFITGKQAYNVVLIGHSLGAMDALVVFQLGYGSSLLMYALPFVVPNEAILVSPSPAVDGPRQVIAYGGHWDTIANKYSSCYGSTNNCRAQLCNTSGLCQFFEIDTGQGFFTLSNPHDRCKYQQVADPSLLVCW